MKKMSYFVLFALLSFSIYAQDSKTTLTTRDYLALQYPSNITLSEDGTQVLFTVREVDFEKSRFYRHVWKVDINNKEPRQITFSDGSELAPAWSPDASWITFLSNRTYHDNEGISKRTQQVWIMSSFFGEAQQLTNFPGGVSNYCWAPAGDKIICITRSQPSIQEQKKHLQQSKQKFDSNLVGEPLLPMEIWIVDMQSRKAKQICTADAGMDEIDCSPVGNHLVYSV